MPRNALGALRGIKGARVFCFFFQKRSAFLPFSKPAPQVKNHEQTLPIDAEGRTAETGAAPSAFLSRLLPSRTALLVIDVQRDFVASDGAAAGWGADLTGFAQPLRHIQALIAAARAARVPIVFLRVVTRPETDSATLRAFHDAAGNPPAALAVCRAGTPGAEYHIVQPEPGDVQIEKLLYSGFHGTALDEALRAAAVDTLVVTGFTTECCVDCTVRDAFHHGYLPFVVRDACAAYDTAMHEAALVALAASFALVTDTAAVIGAWTEAELRERDGEKALLF